MQQKVYSISKCFHTFCSKHKSAPASIISSAQASARPSPTTLFELPGLLICASILQYQLSGTPECPDLLQMQGHDCVGSGTMRIHVRRSHDLSIGKQNRPPQLRSTGPLERRWRLKVQGQEAAGDLAGLWTFQAFQGGNMCILYIQ